MIETKAYQPIGLCIYCNSGQAQEKFTDEHIIPYGLGWGGFCAWWKPGSMERAAVLT